MAKHDVKIGRLGPDETEELLALLERARHEDGADLTTEALLGPEVTISGRVVVREPARVAGLPAAVIACEEFGATLAPAVTEGGDCEADTVVARMNGPARAVLASERIVLNILSRLSGIATLTSRYVRAFHPTGVYDTRKTTPGWRCLEKYAVRTGGGRNHRFALDDQFLVKDNHFCAMRSDGRAANVTDAVERIRAYRRSHGLEGVKIEVEVETLAAFRDAVRAEADIVMLDNWTTAETQRALAWLKTQGPRRVQIELSGGITLDRAPELAGLGADRVSAGALTSAARGIDFSLDLEDA